jgi:hypothetical protein
MPQQRRCRALPNLLAEKINSAATRISIPEQMRGRAPERRAIAPSSDVISVNGSRIDARNRLLFPRPLPGIGRAMRHWYPARELCVEGLSMPDLADAGQPDGSVAAVARREVGLLARVSKGGWGVRGLVD